jgi:hypothetical protein
LLAGARGKWGGYEGKFIATLKLGVINSGLPFGSHCAARQYIRKGRPELMTPSFRVAMNLPSYPPHFFLFMRITTPAFGAVNSAFLRVLFAAVALGLLAGARGKWGGYEGRGGVPCR